jgi:hypothetical protein
MRRLQTILINHNEKSFFRFLTEYRYPEIWTGFEIKYFHSKSSRDNWLTRNLIGYRDLTGKADL